MRRQFDQPYIRAEFDRIGNALESHLQVFLIGGGSMAFRDLKATTKDIDVVVETRAAHSRLKRVLQDEGYEEVRDPSDEYLDLGAQTILENSDGCRFDIFNQQVADKLVFSQGMKSRSEPLEVRGKLTVRMSSAEDIFLFKSVAGRTDDIEDMNMLVQSGLDFETIRDELEAQTELLGEEHFVTFIGEAFGELEERFGVAVPIHDLVVATSARVYDQLAILLALDEPKRSVQLRADVDLDEGRFTEMLRELERKGNVERSGEIIRKINDRP